MDLDLPQFEARKRDHLRHALDPQHQARGLSDLDQVQIPHEAVPDLDFEQVTLELPFLDRKLRTPFFIPGMTAGHADAMELNHRIAERCLDRGWAFGVGSQRRDLALDAAENAASVDQWKSFRAQFRDLFLVSNLGITQIIRADLDSIRRVMDRLDADFLMIHLNALQEALQPEGTPQFAGAWLALERLARSLGRPVGVKETGCGLSARTLARLKSLGLAAIDCSGLGGTHWGRIEGARAPEGSLQKQAAKHFENWGISTVQSVRDAHHILAGTDTEIWASGGVRSGLDAAKLIALGAHRVGAAQPALEHALLGQSQLDHWMQGFEFELKLALFCTGSATLSELRGLAGGARA